MIAALASTLTPHATQAGEAVAGHWPDTPAARAKMDRLLHELNAALLEHDSATLTLEHWCAALRMAEPARVVARRVRGAHQPLPPDLRAELAPGPHESVSYRRVQLSCGGRVLSEADNWYLPDRLSAAMNRQLDSSDMPFGKVVKPLQFQRHTLSAELLWSPAADESAASPSADTADPPSVLSLPREVMRHHALLIDGQGHPFSVLIETYTRDVLGFPSLR